jgi:hypothetical protein
MSLEQHMAVGSTGSMLIVPTSEKGISRNVLSIGECQSSQGWIHDLPSAALPANAAMSRTSVFPRKVSRTSGKAGNLMIEIQEDSSSGTVAIQSR